MERFKKTSLEVEEICSLIIEKNKLEEYEEDDYYKGLIELNNRMNGNSICVNNKTKIYDQVEDYYENLFLYLKKAKKYIYIEMYIIENDEIGNQFLDILLSKVKEGVKVILLFDQCGSRKINKNKVNELEKSGACFSYFRKSFRGFILNMNYRNHRKIIIVDSEIAFIGGVNIGDEYLSNHKRITPWRDTQMEIKGEAILFLLKQFYIDYHFALFQKRKFSIIRVDESDFKVKKNNGFTPIQIVSSSFHNTDERVHYSFKKTINMARRKIRIQTPYFVPSQEIYEALKLALLSGVEILIMIPKIYDKRIPYFVTMYYINELRKLGAKIYFYHGFIHSKVVIIDDDILLIGSANIDIRSMRYNYETNACIISKNEVFKYNTIFCKDIKMSSFYELNEVYPKGVRRKIEQKIYLLFSQIM